MRRPSSRYFKFRNSQPTVFSRRPILERLEDRLPLTVGSLDPTSAYETPAASDIALADGKTIVVGYSGSDFQVARFNADGTRDSSFASGGTFSINTGYPDGYFANYTFLGREDQAPAGVAVQADGKIVATHMLWNGGDDISVIRLDTNGSLDPTFDGDGQLTFDFSSENLSYSDVPQTILVRPDGKIVVVATHHKGSSASDFAIARLESDGSLDNSFDGNGKKLIDFLDDFGEKDIATSAAFQSDGKLVIAGYGSGFFSNTPAYELARLNDDGSIDDSFGNGQFGQGRAVIPPFANLVFVRDMVIQPDDRIVLTASHPLASDSVVARLDSNGNLESEVNITVVAKASGLALQPDGAIVVAGTSPLSSDFAVARLKSDLTPYENGVGFLARTIAFGESAQATRVALQPDGKVIIAGRAQGNSALAMARLTGTGSLDLSFSEDGKILLKPIQAVTIDIQPDSLNLDSNGLLTVLIYGAPDFNTAQIDVSTVCFAGAAAWQNTLVDANHDGRLDLQLKFRRQDTVLDDIYAQLLIDDHDADGVLDSTRQTAQVEVTGQTLDDALFSGSDSINLFLSGRSLRNLLDDLFG